MSSGDFKPRKARKHKHSDNAKTTRNRAAEVAKTGFEAAELKARSAYRVNKSRGLAKLHESSGWKMLSEREQAKRENEVVMAAEEKLFKRMNALRQEWGRKLVENDFETDEEPPEGGNDDDIVVVNDGDVGDVGDSDEWEDVEEINETLNAVFRDSEREWNIKMRKLEEIAVKEYQDNQ
jgi:hypothetical protein